MLSKSKIAFNRAREHLNGKYLILTFAILFIAATSEAFSPKPIANFWFGFNEGLTGVIANATLFLVLIINVFIFNKEFKTNYMLYNRFSSFKDKIKSDLISIIMMSLIIFLTHIILLIAAAIINSLGYHNPIDHIYYDLDTKIYIVFAILRLILYVVLIPSFTYLITIIKNQKIYVLLMAILLVSFLVPFGISPNVSSFFEGPISFMGYLCGFRFVNFETEVISSIIMFSIYFIIFAITYTYRISKKVDV